MISDADRPLDLRSFQDIVDHARRVIPRYCPEWTDHNLSDPGITLLELFAWMTEVMLYRLNRVPDEMYERFLDLIGVQREPPAAAATHVTFYVSGPSVAVIRAGTEVATPRTEFDDPVVFTTVEDLAVPVTTIQGTLLQKAGGTAVESEVDRDGYVTLFGDDPGENDELRIVLAGDLRGCSIALRLDCRRGEASHLDPRHPPYRWEYAAEDVWREPLSLDAAGTGRRLRRGEDPDPAGGFADFRGTVYLHLPRDLVPVAAKDGTLQTWLRIRHVPSGRESYQRSPQVRFLRCDVVAATVEARNFRTVAGETLGRSTGVPGERFPLYDRPVLRRAGAPHRLRVQRSAPTGSNGHALADEWSEVNDFAVSGPDNRHFVMDYLRGEARFGPSVPGREGDVEQHGAVPAANASVMIDAYASGGGVRGNVREGTVTQLRSAIPYVVGVANHEDARGGLDAESLESARMRALAVLQGSSTLITRDDYARLPVYIKGIARAVTVTHDDDPRIPGGEVRLLVVPIAAARTAEPLKDSDFEIPRDVQDELTGVLTERTAIGSRWRIIPPGDFVQRFSLEVAAVFLPSPDHPYEGRVVSERAVRALLAYFHPVTGGADGKGWPPGAGITQGAVTEALRVVPGITYVAAIQLSDASTKDQMVLRPAPGRLLVAERIAVDVRLIE